MPAFNHTADGRCNTDHPLVAEEDAGLAAVEAIQEGPSIVPRHDADPSVPAQSYQAQPRSEEAVLLLHIVLRRITAEGYRMLRNVDVALGPLTVLIGENDSGKSTLLRAISGFVQPRAWNAADAWRGEASTSITLLANVNGRDVQGTQHQLRQGDFKEEGQAAAIRGWLGQLSAIELPRAGAAMSGEAVADTAGPPALDSTGSLLPGLLDHLQRRHRERFERFIEAARERIQGLQDVTLVADNPKVRTIHLTVEGGHDLDANQASAGVRAMLFFLALAYHPRPSPVLLVEEPETGLHPQRMADVVDLLRSITRGEHAGRAAQVILSTHSPYLLDHVDPAEDRVLVFRRGPEGDAVVMPADRERLQSFLGELMLGEVWFNQGEAGLVARPETQ